MANLFPCPNTQCGYQFDADMLPAAAMVTCPLCRTRFPYRAARPVPAAVVEDQTSGDAPPPMTSRVVNVRSQPKSGGILITMLWIVGSGLLMLGVLYWMHKLSTQQPNRGRSQEINLERMNIRMDPFPPGWEEDMKPREGMELNVFARKRSSPDGWIGLFAEDFKDRNPRAGEMKDRMLSRLKNYGRNMNFVELSDAKWLGQPGQAYQFQGDFNDSPVLGECVAVSHKGIGYIFYAWATDRDWEAVKGELLEMRGRVKLANYRDKWTEEKSNTKVYTNQKPAYTIEDMDAAWQMAAVVEEGMPSKKTDYNVDPKEIDPAASFAFRAKFQIKVGGDTRQIPAEAKALVVELPQGGDPLETIKKHVIERIKKDYANDPPEIKLEPLAKSPANISLPNSGPQMARLLFIDPLNKEDRHMYIISAINVEGMTVGIETDVLERNGSYVEEWMVHLAGSLKAGK
ncbi:zinc ribbon domain-containing protein [Zavarzinella formosa]|uniref:hypothetical protein n=1 Tax=Zavarzinella formosa TaxID=360055 RepID=UPI0002F983FE|nr:hypothetical protein [Zavarzinella formosa]